MLPRGLPHDRTYVIAYVPPYAKAYARPYGLPELVFMLAAGLYVAGEQWRGVACTPGVGGSECLTLAQNLSANFAAFEPEKGVEHIHCCGRISYCCVRVRIIKLPGGQGVRAGCRGHGRVFAWQGQWCQ